MQRFFMPGFVSHLLVLALLFPLADNAQTTTTTLQGTITGEDGKPLPYAAVQLKRITLGTLANEAGQFVLRVPAINATDSVLVSYVGYAVKTVAAAALQERPATITLQPKTINLPTQTVLALSPEELIKEAVKKLPQNLHDEPALLAAFYREARYVRDTKLTNVKGGEAVLAIYHTGADENNPLNNMADQVRVLRSREVGQIDDEQAAQMLRSLPDLKGAPYKLLGEDAVKYSYDRTFDFLNERQFKKYDYTLRGVVALGGGEAYEITFDQKDAVRESLFQGRVLLDRTTLAIAEVDFKLSEKGRAFASGFSLFGIGAKVKESAGQARYVPINGRWYLNYLRRYIAVTITAKTQKRKEAIGSKFNLEPVFDVGIVHELFVTGHKSTDVQPLPKNEVLGKNEIAYKKSENYDDAFWGEYNYIRAGSVLATATLPQ
jgi:hypothetical protein